MNILFDLGHPAHVHLFRNVARTLESFGHDIFISIRDRKDIKDLLKLYRFTWHSASTPRTGLAGLTRELIEHDLEVFKLAKKYKFDVMVGTSVAVSHIAKLLPGVRSAVFSEDDAEVVPLFAKLTYPFADYVVVPRCISDKLKPNYVLHESYHELSYLHPNHFKPDRSVLTELDIGYNERYFIVRIVALKAHHDIKEAGMSRAFQKRLLKTLEGYGRVFVSSEEELPKEFSKHQMHIPPDMMHHAIAFSTMMVTDSQTMALESAVLGIPVFRCNTFVGRLSVLNELDNVYNLSFGFRPAQAELMLKKIREILTIPDFLAKWREKRDYMLSKKIDLHLWMVDFLNKLLSEA